MLKQTLPFRILAVAIFGCSYAFVSAQDLSKLPTGAQSRWFSFENPTGEKGKAASTNNGQKGAAFDKISPGQTRVLCQMEGPGTIRRMWFTFRPFAPEALRSVRLDMYWDHSKKPAVSVPIGDFFAAGLGLVSPYQSALLSNPEGRSFNCYIPMPFRTGARIEIKNESDKEVSQLFYDIDATSDPKPNTDQGYFHAFWRRDPHTALGKDYELLPKIEGKGRYLGASIGVQGDPQYGDSGWGEGEVKMYLDGDQQLPTISGTGTEDYIGTGWGMGHFNNLYQGCTVNDEKNHRWCFYRQHIPDPIYFYKDCRITIQDIGGDATESVRKMAAAGVELQPITAGIESGILRLLSDPTQPKLNDPKFPLDAWVNFFRRDDYSSVVYFYLDHPTTNLPPLAPVAERIAGLPQPAK